MSGFYHLKSSDFRVIGIDKAVADYKSEQNVKGDSVLPNLRKQSKDQKILRSMVNRWCKLWKKNGRKRGIY